MKQGERYPGMTVEYLRREYREKNRSCADIAADWGCSPSTVERRVRQFGIRKENHEIYGVRLLTGMTFGKWTIGPEVRKPGTPTRYYECTCSCPLATVQLVPAHRLREDSPRPSRTCNACVLRAVGKTKDRGFGDIPGYYWRNLCENAKRNDVPMEITIEYAWVLYQEQDGRCALTGLPIGFGPSKKLKNQTTASLDRIDASGWYTEGNVRWVHKVVNRMRWELPDDRFISLCRAVVEQRRGDFGTA
jgi:hypothetical protein